MERRTQLVAWITPAVVAVLGSLAVAELPDQLRLTPRWVLPLVFVLLVLAALAAHWGGRYRAVERLWYAITALLTIAQLANILLLLRYLPSKEAVGKGLFADAALLWGLNILLFTLWYWQLDGGGPRVRSRGEYQSGDFVFPQANLPASAESPWKPGFLDYFYLAFNANITFGTTDTVALSNRAKVLIMIQTGSSFVLIGVIAARAVNIL